MRNQATPPLVPGSLASSAALCALLLAACPGPDSTLTCGPNTEAIDGKCVSTVDQAPCGTGASRNATTGQCEPDVECGAGTTYDAQTQQCQPDSACGPGTKLNEGTGQCEPDVVCGSGTTFDPSTGACRPNVICGEGTHLDAASGFCLPDPNCGTGTTFDDTTQSCLPDLVCGPGLTAIDDVCLSAIDLLLAETDASESAIDNNDPAVGGTPESLSLEEIGERAVFTGTISRPVDRNNDDVIDQDRDVWRFTASAGQMLRVRVLSTGAIQPGFTITGPNGYYREPQRGFAVDADREVVLPYDGEYDVTVLPILVLLGASEPIGADDAVYAGIVEKLDWPTPVALSAANTGEAVTATGTLLGLSDNFFRITASASTPLIAEATTTTGSTIPSLLLFTEDGTLVQESAFTSNAGVDIALAATFFDDSDGLVAVLDWETSDGIDVPFTLSASTADTVDFGPISVGETVVLPRQPVLGFGGISFTFEAVAGQVVLTHFKELSGSVVLRSPGGETLYNGPFPSFQGIFLAKESGAYRWIVASTSTNDRMASVAIKSFTPHDAGSYDGTAALTASFSGDAIPAEQRPGGEWFLVENTAPAIVRFDFEFQAGIPDLEVFSLNEGGVAVDRSLNGEDDPATLRAYRSEPAVTLARLGPSTHGSNPDPWVRDWRVDVTADEIPALSEFEPNDDQEMIDALPALPVRLLGAASNDDSDFFSLALEPALSANEAIVIDVQHFGPHATSSAPTVWFRVREPVGDTVLYSSEQVPLSRWMLFPGDGPGPFVVEVMAKNASEGLPYLLEVERVSVNTEVENNDTLDTPQDLGTLTLADLPFAVYGNVDSTESDVYRVALDEALPAGTALRVRAENLVENHDLRFAAYDAAKLKLSEVDHQDGVLFVPVPSLDSVLLEVKGESSTRTDLYRVVIDVISPVESEPNDSIAVATPLPALAAGESTALWGIDESLAEDYFQINLDPPLEAGESLLVRWSNAVARGDINVSLRDGADSVIIASETYAGVIPFAPIGDSGPFYVRVSPAGSSFAPPQAYLLEVERTSGFSVDSEPNDDTASAQALSVPAQVLGLWNEVDADLYRVTLANDLGTGERLIVDLEVPYADDLVSVRVLDEAGDELAAAIDLVPYLELDPPTTSAGAVYFVEVKHGTDLFLGEQHLYDMIVDVGVP